MQSIEGALVDKAQAIAVEMQCTQTAHVDERVSEQRLDSVLAQIQHLSVDTEIDGWIILLIRLRFIAV